ncbi:MAG: hypothetical protein ACTSYT_00335, partial [Candidatus Asgardarchaeia archaeon]
VKYTIRFIEECWSKYKIFNKTEIIKILKLIKCSNFRVEKKIIERVLCDIEEAKNEDNRNN